MKRRHERPLRRVYADGRVVWVARWTDRHGRRTSAGTFELRGPCRNPDEPDWPFLPECCAQHAIDASYDREVRHERDRRRPDTVGVYTKTWLQRRPRSDRTNESYRTRLRAVLDVELDGRPLRDWPMADVRRRQVNDLINEMLTVQGRAQRGALGILLVLSALWRDAIDDEILDHNPFLGVGVKAADPRIRKPPLPVRVFTWQQMHDFARAAAAVRSPRRVVSKRGVGVTGRGVSAMSEIGPSELDRWRSVYAEPMVRVLSDCGLRLGEMLALQRGDWQGDLLHIRRTVWRGQFLHGTKTDHGMANAGRVAPVPQALQALLAAIPPQLDPQAMLFPTPRGSVWRESPFYRLVWRPARKAMGIDPRPHEFRHSFVSLMRAAHVIDDADLAAVAGHTVMTMLGHYTHPMKRSYDAMRGVIDSE